jgi:hypothetical protein
MNSRLKYGGLERSASVWSVVNPTLPKNRLTNANYDKVLDPYTVRSALHNELRKRKKRKKPETKFTRMAKKAKASKLPLGPRAASGTPKPKAQSLRGSIRGSKIIPWINKFLAKPMGPNAKKAKQAKRPKQTKDAAATKIQAAYRGKKARNRLAAARR